MNRSSVFVSLACLALAIAIGAGVWNQRKEVPVVKKNEKAKEVKIQPQKPDPLPEEKDPPMKVESWSKWRSSSHLVEPNLKKEEWDFAERCFTPEDLVKMAEKDKKFDDEGHARENGLREWKTSRGTFRMVVCNDRYSVNPKAKNNGGWCMETLQLPSGKWLPAAGLRFLGTLEKDGHLFLICSYHVFRWLGNDKFECVATFDTYVGAATAPRICSPDNGWLAGKYVAVNKSMDSNFGGLLEYDNGTWLFHQYKGERGSWVQKAEEKQGEIILHFVDGWGDKKGDSFRLAPAVTFDPVEGQFKDL